MRLPELLAPAGNFEKLKTALHYGADAVYMGQSEFSLRARADNFTSEELGEAVKLVRERGRKAYITVNIFAHNKDIPFIRDHLISLKKMSPDALIISDVGVFETAAEVAPEIPIHVSTQANVTNYSAARFWENLGVKRLVLSRELTIEEIKQIRENVSVEIECFVHGAICISYSGRCYISSFLANRAGNRGECTNSCRWNYTLMEEKRPEEYHPVYENDRGTYIMSSRDLCMIEHLDKLTEAGVDSFKIEGRMKGINYLAGVVKTYREAVDSLKNRPYKMEKNWRRELSMISSRGYTTGMFFGKQPDTAYNHDDDNVYKMSHELVGVVKSAINGKIEVALRSKLEVGDIIEFLSMGLENKTFYIKEMYSREGVPVAMGKHEETVLIPAYQGVKENDLIRRPLNHSS